MLKRLLYGTLILTFFTLQANHSLKQPSQRHTTAPFRASPSVIVQLFEWKWDDVAQECETVLRTSGFAAVQISPPNEHVVLPHHNFPWWQRYQPVSYIIHSRSGDRQQFANMVERCHAAGVKIYADAVINHMSAEASGVGTAGSRFTKYHYPGLYEPQHFHTCRHEMNYSILTDVTQCELVGLPDLDTGANDVRQRIAAYLIDLVQLGVNGFRIDAAKHIHTDDVGAILSIVNAAVEPDPYIYQEVIDPGNEAVQKSVYYPHGLVHEVEYGRLVSESFIGISGQTLSQLQSLGEDWRLMPSDRAIVFIDNHDKQRGHAGGGTYLTYKDGLLYTLANVFMLAYPYGTPLVMSSYAFSTPDQGPPADDKGNTKSVHDTQDASCLAGWVCEHRQWAIARMVGFRNSVSPDSPVTHWWSNGNNQIAFGRGDQGFVVINREDTPLSQTFQTGLPAGRYCNILAPSVINPEQPCTSATADIIVASSGQATITVEKMSAIAIHQAAKREGKTAQIHRVVQIWQRLVETL
ncbi:alpha-amylase family protein [Oculatella sp. LEGE 06141]|uniref:alpha-amylase n=1 Tax=Oculatella sp. LEGE 06141 TaxID=1828648 RepID=UPI00188010A0|nr:alpha-amylase family protein [Oculatella sp. LEGE 06141]MBE9179609.1 alpha-amylase family protein [Oculatella sp. LEGE 06141]